MEYPNNEKDMTVESDTPITDDCSKCESDASTETATTKDFAEMEKKILKKVFWRDFAISTAIGIVAIFLPIFFGYMIFAGAYTVKFSLAVSLGAVCIGGIVWLSLDKKIRRQGRKAGIIVTLSIFLLNTIIIASVNAPMMACADCGRLSSSVYYDASDANMSWPYCEDCGAKRDRCANYPGERHENYGICLKEDMTEVYEPEFNKSSKYCPDCAQDECSYCNKEFTSKAYAYYIIDESSDTETDASGCQVVKWKKVFACEECFQTNYQDVKYNCVDCGCNEAIGGYYCKAEDGSIYYICSSCRDKRI